MLQEIPGFILVERMTFGTLLTPCLKTMGVARREETKE
jgi:hypothetical protein